MSNISMTDPGSFNLIQTIQDHTPIISTWKITYHLSIKIFNAITDFFPCFHNPRLVNRVVERLDQREIAPSEATPSPSINTSNEFSFRKIVPIPSSTDPLSGSKFDSVAIENFQKVLSKLPDTIIRQLLWETIPVLGEKRDKTLSSALRYILDEKMIPSIRDFEPDTWRNVVQVIERFSNLVRDFTKDKSISNIQILDEFFKHITNELLRWFRTNYPEAVSGREEEMQGHINQVMREKLHDKKFKNISNFVINFYRFALTGLRKFVDDQTFRQRISEIFTDLDKPAKELIEQNLDLLQQPIRNALKLTQNISADDFFDTIIEVTHYDIEGIQKAIHSQNRHLQELHYRKERKKQEIEDGFEERRNFIHDARAASKILSTNQDLADEERQKLERIQDFLQDVQEFQGDDESFIRTQIHKKYNANNNDKPDVIAEREVCRKLLQELFQQLGGKEQRMKGLFVRWINIHTTCENPRPMWEILESFFRDPPSIDDQEPESYDGDLMRIGHHLGIPDEEEFNRNFHHSIQRTWVQRRTFADFIKYSRSQPQVAKVITNRQGMTLEELKEESVDNIAHQLCQTMFPPVQHTFVDGTQKEVNGIYTIWSHLKFPPSMKNRLNQLHDLMMETLADSDIPESEKALFHRNLLAFTEMFLMEFVQVEVKQLIKLGLNKGLEQVLDPTRFNLLMANKILPSIENLLFLGHVSLLMRHEIQTFLPLYFELHKARNEDEANIELEKIAGHIHLLLRKKTRHNDDLGYSKEKIISLITPSNYFAEANNRHRLNLEGKQPDGFLDKFVKGYLLGWIKESPAQFLPHYQSLLQKDKEGQYHLVEGEGLRDGVANHLYQIVQRELKHYYLSANDITPAIFANWVKPLAVDSITEKIKTDLRAQIEQGKVSEKTEANIVEGAIAKVFDREDIPHMGELIHGVVEIGDLNGWIARWGVNRFQSLIGTAISNAMIDIRENWNVLFESIGDALIPFLDPVKLGEILSDQTPQPEYRESNQLRAQRIERVSAPLLKNYLDQLIEDLPYGTGKIVSWLNMKPSTANLADAVKSLYDRVLNDRERRQVLILNIVHAIESRGLFGK